MKQLITIEAFNLETNEAIGYFLNKAGRKQRRRFNFKITNVGRPEISKPSTIRQKDYETILNRLGKSRGFSFTEIEKMYSQTENRTGMSAQ